MGVAKVTLNGSTLMDTTGKTVAADKMLASYTALDKAGNNVTGSIATKTSSNLTASGATVTAPAGYYASDASKSVSTMTLPTAASSTSSGTSKATIGRSTSAQYINIPTGYNSAASYYTISATANMTLPTAASSTSSGTSKATISRSTSAQYINIPTGYNGTASYYTISATPNMTLPTSTSTSGLGTQKAEIQSSTGTTYKYINIPIGYNASEVHYAIAPVNATGLVYETGTWTPTTDVASSSINFANSHTSAPMFIGLSDATGGYYTTTYSNRQLVWFDNYKLTNTGVAISSSSMYYARYDIIYRANYTTTLTTSSSTCSYNSDQQGSSSSYPSYNVSGVMFRVPATASNAYWRSGRTYKWIAVWAPGQS